MHLDLDLDLDLDRYTCSQSSQAFGSYPAHIRGGLSFIDSISWPRDTKSWPRDSMSWPRDTKSWPRDSDRYETGLSNKPSWKSLGCLELPICMVKQTHIYIKMSRKHSCRCAVHLEDLDLDLDLDLDQDLDLGRG